MIGLPRASRPVFAASFALALAGCHNATITIDDHAGVPLAQLATTGARVSEVTLSGPDTVNVVQGDTFAIKVAGDPSAADALRFVLTDGKLGVERKPGFGSGNGVAIVTITTPTVDHLVMAGSGRISSDQLSGDSVGVTIGGSGDVDVARIAAKQLEAEIAGTGTFTGSGHVGKLALSIAGTGDADLARLQADQADVSVAGTGNGTLASDGTVTGSVVGTGEITVHGKAQCHVSVVGTGKVTCQP